MAVKVYKTSDVKNDGVKCLVYGKSGIGKTSLLATAPKPIILSCESGLLSIADKDIPYINIESVQDIYDAAEYLEEKGNKYKTICLDSISEIAEIVLSDLKKTVKDGRMIYGDLADEMTKVIRHFRDIKGKNVVFVAKQKRIEDDGVQTWVASMPGKQLLDGLPFFFDEVFYMTLKNDDEEKGIRVLKTDVGYEYDAKDRSGKLNKEERPNLTRIFRKIKG